MIPAILEPVPKELQDFLNSDWENYRKLSEHITDWQESEIEKGVNESETWNIVETAICWLDDRQLDNGYLTNAPRIWIWSDEKDVIFSWDNRNIAVENIPVWSAIGGNYRISKENFINELQKFDSNLIAEMKARVKTICRNWNKPEIKVNFEQLKSEQKVRANWFDLSLNAKCKTDWNKVISAIKIVNS